MQTLDTKDYILIKTSGSTGKPKTIKVKKQAMVNSAHLIVKYWQADLPKTMKPPVMSK